MSKLARAQNGLIRGWLSRRDAVTPGGKAYAMGLEEARGWSVSPMGLRPGLAPKFDPVKAVTLRTLKWEDAYFIRNDIGGAEEVSSPYVPTGDVPGYETLVARTSRIMNNGENLASVWNPTYDGSDFPLPLIDGASSDTERTLIVTKPTRFYRGFFAAPAGATLPPDGGYTWTPPPGGDQPTSTLPVGWSLHGHVTTAGFGSDPYHGMRRPITGFGVDLYGGFRGNAHAAPEFFRSGGTSTYAEVTITLLYEDIQPGVYLFDPGRNISLVNVAGFLKTAPRSSVTATFSAHSDFGSNPLIGPQAVTVNEDTSVDALTDQSTNLVLAWDGGLPTDAWVPFSSLATKISDDITTPSAFIFTNLTKIVGSRRFGPAVAAHNAYGFGATATGLMNGRTLRTSGDIEATDAYVMPLDGDIVWFEETMSGILIGTTAFEYLMTNHQVAAAYSGGAAIQKIGAVGSPGAINDLILQSAVLGGNVFFISNMGVSSMFSVFGQSSDLASYLPRHYEFKGLPLEGKTVTSISAFTQQECLILTVSDNTLWALWPDTTALIQIDVPLPEGDSLVGAYIRDDNLWLVCSTPTIEQYVVAGYAASAPESYLRTTAFGRAPGVRVIVKKLMVTADGLKAGEYRIGNGDWKSFLSLDEVMNGMTGTKEFYVRDSLGKLGLGKTVEFRIRPSQNIGDPGTLIALGVEMEVM